MAVSPTRPRSTWLLAVVCAATTALAAWVGMTTVPRLSDHAGYHLVAVVDSVRVAHPSPPRSLSLVVVDGLRKDVASTMSTVATLGGAGQCRTTDVGPYTVSRPVYSLLSTGLEVARTGARNNYETSPLRAESVWAVAAQAGWRVGVTSHLAWWRELFGKAFAESTVVGEDEDVFTAAAALDVDVRIIHPVAVDTAGHAHGGGSEAYREAARRVDTQASAWLATLDLDRDVVIFTADHGHVDAGGHGAIQPEVHQVLTCIAGPAVLHDERDQPLDARVVAPLVAVALGVRFPRHMRAVEDPLDQLWSIFDGLPSEYRDDRVRAIAVFRQTNTTALAELVGPGHPATWSAFWAQRQRSVLGRGAVAVLLIVVSIGLGWRWRGLTRPQMLQTATWLIATTLVTLALWVGIRGSLDYTSINTRGSFIPASVVVCSMVAALAGGIHAWLIGGLKRWTGDTATLALLVTALLAAHIAVLGWPLGDTIPHRMILFFPFIGSVFAAVHGGLATLGALACATGLRRSQCTATPGPPPDLRTDR